MDKLKEKIVILYDGNDCFDGFGGAWAAWKKFGNKANYIGVLYNKPIPKGLKNKKIYMIDFTYPEKIIKKLIKENKQVTSIDHHISAEKVVKMTKNYSFALNHSGSVLAWKYFHSDKPVPLFLKYIEDMDIWKKSLPHTEQVHAYYKTFISFNFKIFNKAAVDFENKKILDNFIKKGEIILKYEKKLIRQLLTKNTESVIFNRYKTYAINSPFFNSEIGMLLSKKSPHIGIVWKKESGENFYISLRSNGKVDVAKIAKKFGGGGHKKAAAFRWPGNKKLPWRTIK